MVSNADERLKRLYGLHAKKGLILSNSLDPDGNKRHEITHRLTSEYVKAPALFSFLASTILTLFFTVSTIIWAIGGGSAEAARSEFPYYASSQDIPVLNSEILSLEAYGGEDIVSFEDGILLPKDEFSLLEVEEKEEPKKVAKKTAISTAKPVAGRLTQGLHGHNGVDFGAPVGTVVSAMKAGTVKVSKTGGWNGGYGTYVIVKHDDGTETLYAHLDENYVSVGETVEAGEALGTVGLTGKTTGPHLHFEVHGGSNPYAV